MLSCWSYNASNRPTFTQIVAKMSEILAMASDYLSFSPSWTDSGGGGGLQEQMAEEKKLSHTFYEQESRSNLIIPSPPPPPHEQEGEREGVFVNHTLVKEDLGLKTDKNHTVVMQELEPNHSEGGKLEPDVI